VSLTYPQIIMMGHAAAVNSKRHDRNYKSQQSDDPDDPVVMNGKRMSQLNDEELDRYYGTLGLF
jgi:hypothetical protein